MTALLLIIMILTETGFMVFELTKKSSKKTWTAKRIIVNAAELALFFVMVLLPGIDTSFRFKGLIAILILWLATAGIFWMANRKIA